jgi:DNA-binding response OmpR family regulator
MASTRSKILFVEDHEDTRDLFALVLSQENYDVVTVPTVERALYQANTEQFDLVVLDSRLTDGSGVDLCRNIRKIDQSMPILFCSGLAYEKNKEEALAAGAQGYLVKPVSIPVMCQTVKELISSAHGQARRNVLSLGCGIKVPAPDSII